jgi:hypothetical protein
VKKYLAMGVVLMLGVMACHESKNTPEPERFRPTSNYDPAPSTPPAVPDTILTPSTPPTVQTIFRRMPKVHNPNYFPRASELIRDSTLAKFSQLAGFVIGNGDVSGVMPTGFEDYRQYTLNVGQFQFLGMCGRGCSEMEMALLDNGGNEISIGVNSGTSSLVNHTINIPGNYQLRVQMVKCSERACVWGAIMMTME